MRPIRSILLATALIGLPGLALAFDQTTWIDPGALADVREVHVAPVVLALPETPRLALRDHGPRPVRPEDAKARADELARRLRRGLAADFTLVDAAGPGVLVVETTLSSLASSRPTMADYQQRPGLSFRSIYAGGAEVEIRLSRDGREIARFSDRYRGTLADGMPRVGVWQDADRAFSRWARQLPAALASPQVAARD